jgi:hypothetical protein
MKRLFTLAMVATLLTAGSAFADRHFVAQPNATFSFGVGGAAAGPTTTNNDDSCDIGVTPAATLLLPYFEVETATRAVDTFFTVVNTSYLPQIAHVVVWTDWSYPVLDFNIFLTGYDVQSISMYDVIVNGIIAPVPAGSVTTGGTSSTPSATGGSGQALSPIGAFSAGFVSPTQTQNSNSGQNPNIPSLASCGTLPGTYSQTLRATVQALLTNGAAANVCTLAGSPSSSHPTATTAIGYVTIDVAAVCSQNMADAPAYFATEILFDNVLTGDYEILNKAAGSNYAGGNPLVHIRAIPEGGPAGVALVGQQTNLPYTFYSRYINGQTLPGGAATFATGLANYDRRQPLPSTFAARWIQGGAGAFNTSYRIWREGVTIAGTTCNGSGINSADLNSALPVTDMVRFDEHENPALTPGNLVSGPTAQGTPITFPETGTYLTSDLTRFPAFQAGTTTDNAGWMYLNLNSGLAPTTANTVLHPTWPAAGARPSQNWVIVSMNAGGSSNGLFGVDFDATWLGNGCNPPTPVTGGASAPRIGPAGGVLVCPLGDPGCTPGVGKYTGTNTTP